MVPIFTLLFSNCLIHFMLLLSFYISQKHQRISGFLVFSRGIEISGMKLVNKVRLFRLPGPSCIVNRILYWNVKVFWCLNSYHVMSKPETFMFSRFSVSLFSLNELKNEVDSSSCGLLIHFVIHEKNVQ